MISVKKREKRTHNTRCEPRILVNADIKGTVSVLSKLRLVDISNKGALVKTPQRLAVGGIFRVKFAHGDNKGAPITLRCKVVRCGFTRTIFGDDGEPIPLYLVGFKFIELNKELVKELKMFIAKEEILLKKKREEEAVMKKKQKKQTYVF